MDAKLLGLISPQQGADWEHLTRQIDVTAPLPNPLWVYDRLQPQTFREDLYVQALTSLELYSTRKKFEKNLANYEKMMSYKNSRSLEELGKDRVIIEVLALDKNISFIQVRETWLPYFVKTAHKITRNNYGRGLIERSPAWKFVRYFSKTLNKELAKGGTGEISALERWENTTRWLREETAYPVEVGPLLRGRHQLNHAVYYWWRKIRPALLELKAASKSPLLGEVYDSLAASENYLFVPEKTERAAALLWAFEHRKNLTIEDLVHYYLLSDTYNSEWAAAMA